MAGGACGVGDARAREKWRCGGKFGRLTKKCETEQVVRKLVNWRETETMGRLRENSRRLLRQIPQFVALEEI